MNTSEKPLIGFFGHHKCATTWVVHFVNYVCRLTGRKTESLDNPRQYGGDLEAYRKEQKIDFLFMRNSRWSEVKDVPFTRGVHLIRDPRDILVSAYFSHRNSHPTEGWPELVEHRKCLRAVSQEDGLLLEMDFSAPDLEDMATWHYQDERVLELKFEQLISDPFQSMLTAFSHLDVLDDEIPSGWDWLKTRGFDELNRRLRRIIARLPQPRFRLEKVPAEWFLVELHRHRFSKLAGGRRPGEENVNSHFRKGVAGDWKNHFTPKVKEAFDARYGKNLQALGYANA